MNEAERQRLYAEAVQARDVGMARVDQNADPDWKRAAWRVIEGYPPGHVFLAEDVRAAVDEAGYVVHDRRALGPVIHAIARAGWIAKDGYASARTSNLSPKVRWRRTGRR